jgi:hypothetical protein
MRLYMCAIEHEEDGTWLDIPEPHDTREEAIASCDKSELPSGYIQQLYELTPIDHPKTK